MFKEEDYIMYEERLIGDEKMARNADRATYAVMVLVCALLASATAATVIGIVVIFVRHG